MNMVKNVKDILLDNFWIMPATPEYIENGVPYITSKNIKNGKIDFSKANYISYRAYETISKNRPILVGDILISMIGTLGETAEVTLEDGNFYGQNMFLIRLDESKVNKRYFLNFFKSNSVKRDLAGKQNQSTQKYLKANHIEDLQIPIRSLDEQKIIAEILDKLQKIIKDRKEELLNLDKLIKARFVELFGGISDSKIYPYKVVKELTDVISGGTPSREVSEYWEGGTIPWVKTTELQNNIITEIDEHITEAGLDNSSAKLVPAGTVLIAMYGQGKTRGMTGYLGVEACTNQACACILPSDSINQRFLWQYFVLSYDNLRDMAKGGNQPNLNGNIIKNYPVLYPPMELQNQFATFVEQTDKSKVVVQKALDEAQLLFDSLMQKYFG